MENDITSEAAASVEVRLACSRYGARVWRNNVGAGKLENGKFIRWGLCNESSAINGNIKSSDLIGIRPVTITPEMVGTVIGQFICREVKKPGWTYKATDREKSQQNWINLINELGGDAAFTTGELKWRD